MLIWLVVLACLTGIALLFGAPYVPTHKEAVDKAIKLTGLRKGQLMLELGAGDGRIALAAAKKGIKVVAFEVNPLLWVVAKIHTWRYRKLINLRLADFKSAHWPKDAKAIYVFGNKFSMNYVARRLERWPGPIKVICYGIGMPNKEPDKTDGALLRYDVD